VVGVFGIIVALLFFISALSASAQQSAVRTLELFAGMHRIEAEVAATPDSRSFGLMQRESMPNQHGMLFVFPVAARHCMWMRNTRLPLSVAFLDGMGRIINIEDMQPQTEDNHCAAKPAHYALEMNLGWFKERSLEAGYALTGIDKAPAGY
jgi:hypothetical protein